MDLIENSYGECLNIFKGHFFKVSDYIFFKIILLMSLLYQAHN